MKSLTLAIVIPVYNEEDYIGDCLRAISAQTIMPDEVIVVDNNSTDRSAEIARSFPFVKVVKEKSQGIVFARNRGFDAACSDLIGRIDADTQLGPQWVETVKARALQIDEADAVTGPCEFYDASYPRFLFGFHRLIYFWLSRVSFGHTILFGSNMFFYRSMWLRVRQDACKDNAIHEDMDLSTHIEESGGQVRFDTRLLATASARRFHNWRYYPTKWTRTWRRHGLVPALYQSVRRPDETTEY